MVKFFIYSVLNEMAGVRAVLVNRPPFSVEDMKAWLGYYSYFNQCFVRYTKDSTYTLFVNLTNVSSTLFTFHSIHMQVWVKVIVSGHVWYICYIRLYNII